MQNKEIPSQKDLVINTDAYGVSEWPARFNTVTQSDPYTGGSRDPTRIQGEAAIPPLYRGKQQSLTYTGGSGDPTRIQGDLETRPLYRGI